jgi:hypothetical protein
MFTLPLSVLIFVGVNLMDHGVAATSNCLNKCLVKFQQKVDGLNLQPMASVLGDITLTEAKINMEHGCEAAIRAIDCFEKCPMGNMVKQQLYKNKPFKMICMDKREEWKNEVLSCEIKNRERFIETCTAEKLEGYSKAHKKLQTLLHKLSSNPFLINNRNVQEQFGELCKITADVSNCMSEVASNKCSVKSNQLISDAFTASVDGHDISMLRRLSPECERMGNVARSIG